MLSLKQTKNECGSAQDVEAGSPTLREPAPDGMPLVENRRGVGKPGGFTNTSDDPRAGGAVVRNVILDKPRIRNSL
jgi:hypothetical protein